MAVARRRGQGAPALVALEERAVALDEHLAVEHRLDDLGDLGIGRPEVAEVDGATLAVVSDGVVLQVDVHRAGERVRDDQRRRREVIHADVGVDAAFEVAVAGEHRAHGEVVIVDGLRDLGCERARVADAGRAPVADDVETERAERLGEAGLLVIVGHDERSRRERGLHPRGRAGPRRPSPTGSRCSCTT